MFAFASVPIDQVRESATVNQRLNFPACFDDLVRHLAEHGPQGAIELVPLGDDAGPFRYRTARPNTTFRILRHLWELTGDTKFASVPAVIISWTEAAKTILPTNDAASHSPAQPARQDEPALPDHDHTAATDYPPCPAMHQGAADGYDTSHRSCIPQPDAATGSSTTYEARERDRVRLAIQRSSGG